MKFRNFLLPLLVFTAMTVLNACGSDTAQSQLDQTEPTEAVTTADPEDSTESDEQLKAEQTTSTVSTTTTEFPVTTITDQGGNAFLVVTDSDGVAKTDVSGSAVTQVYTTVATVKTTVATTAKQTNASTTATADVKPVETEVTEAVNEQTLIHLSNSGIKVDGNDASVSSDGKSVTISASGDYYFDGSMSDGQIIVSVPDILADPETVKLHLNGISLTGVSDAAIFVQNAENTAIYLEDGTENTISDGEFYIDTTAAIYAKDDLTIKGSGTLTINALYQQGVHCSNDLKITGGTVIVETEMADALRGKTSVTVKGGQLEIKSGGDGLKSTQGTVEIIDGSMNIKAKNDAIQAETAMLISGGSVFAWGDRGLTCALGDVVIDGGTVYATSTDYQPASVSGAQPVAMLNYAAEYVKGIEISLQGTKTICFTPEKKFSYVLISVPQMSGTYSCYTAGIQMKHDGASNGEFKIGSAVSSFTGLTAK